MKIYLALILLVLLMIAPLHAQDVDEKPDLPVPANALFSFSIEGFNSDTIRFVRTEWTSDSRRFRMPYLPEHPTNEDYPWTFLEYDLAANNLRTAYRVQPDKDISKADAGAFQAAGPRSISPDGRYQIYESADQRCDENGRSCSSVLGIKNLDTGQKAITDIAIYSDFIVHWSENSQAFLVEGFAYGGVGLDYGRIPDSLEDIHTVEMNGYGYDEVAFVDISPDGWQVLIRGNGENLLGLTLWDARWPLPEKNYRVARLYGQVILKDRHVSGAKFITGAPDELLVVLEQGIVRYNVKTQDETLINPDVSSTWADWVYFSPDEQYALAYQHRVGYQLSLFRVNPTEE